MEPPLIVTLKLDNESHVFFDLLRKEHFPKHINYLEAHCTLFHKLPAAEIAVQEALTAAGNRTVFTMKIEGVINAGNGVAYTIFSDELLLLHQSLQQRFSKWLTNQDKQPLKPHITIQNKVTAFKALTLYQKLEKKFQPFDVTATGMSSFLYLNGPWQHVSDFNFI